MSEVQNAQKTHESKITCAENKVIDAENRITYAENRITHAEQKHKDFRRHFEETTQSTSESMFFSFKEMFLLSRPDHNKG